MRRCMVFSLYKLCEVNGNNVKFDVWLLQMLWCFTLLNSELVDADNVSIKYFEWKELENLLNCSINIELKMSFNPHIKDYCLTP